MDWMVRECYSKQKPWSQDLKNEMEMILWNPGRTLLTKQQQVPRPKVEHIWPFLRTREAWTCFWIRNLYLLVSLIAKIQKKYQQKTPLAFVLKLIKKKNGICNCKRYKFPENAVKLMANIPLGNYVSLFAKLLDHWLCSTSYSECFKCSNSFNPHNHFMKQVLLLSPFRAEKLKHGV